MDFKIKTSFQVFSRDCERISGDIVLCGRTDGAMSSERETMNVKE